MKDEIKEILEYVLSLTYGNENAIKGVNKILDYITNLQEENEKLRKNQRFHKNGVYSLEYDKETLSDMVENLQQENEELKIESEKLKKCYCNRTDCSGRIKDSKKYDSLQQRIDKAIEYIKIIDNRDYVDISEVRYIYKILDGDSNE